MARKDEADWKRGVQGPSKEGEIIEPCWLLLYTPTKDLYYIEIQDQMHIRGHTHTFNSIYIWLLWIEPRMNEIEPASQCANWCRKRLFPIHNNIKQLAQRERDLFPYSVYIYFYQDNTTPSFFSYIFFFVYLAFFSPFPSCELLTQTLLPCPRLTPTGCNELMLGKRGKKTSKIRLERVFLFIFPLNGRISKESNVMPLCPYVHNIKDCVCVDGGREGQQHQQPTEKVI